jgi:hypothetical protein
MLLMLTPLFVLMSRAGAAYAEFGGRVQGRRAAQHPAGMFSSWLLIVIVKTCG